MSAEHSRRLHQYDYLNRHRLGFFLAVSGQRSQLSAFRRDRYRPEAPAVIDRILAHLGRNAESADPAHPSRAQPRGELLF